jgi:hypothetical protein
MSTSKYIARLIGPLFLIMGLGMVVESDTVRALSAEFLSNLSLIYLAGMLALVAGLAIVNAHNVWVANWRVIITIIGWLSVIGGIVRLLFPGKVQALGAGMVASPNAMIISGIVTLVIGAILSWVGYEHLWEEKKPRPAAAAKSAAKPARARAAASRRTAKRAPAKRRTAKRTTARKPRARPRKRT